MKNYRIILGSFIVSALFLSSCQDIDLLPKDNMPDELFWKTPDDFEKEVNWLYTRTETFGTKDTDSDIAYELNENTTSNGTLIAPNTDALWDSTFIDLRQSNMIIEKSQTYEGDPSEIERYVAEARFFRAYSHFRLMAKYNDIPILDSLRKENKIRVETLGESGAWFKECFKVTPATAVTTLTDVRGEGNKTVWFNSRYYRANLLWEKGTFRFRDIHLFDESYKSVYLEKPGDGNQFLFYTLPVVDGFMWSEGLDRAGLRIVRLDKDGDKEELSLDHPVVTEIGKDTLVVSAEDSKGHAFKITFYETRFEVVALSKEADFSWALELKAAAGKELPFTVIEDKAVNASFDGFNYVITCEKGHIRKPESGSDYVFRMFPSDQEIVIDCTNARK